MSDIERICAVNHNRRKWAEEVEAGYDPSVSRADSSPCAGKPLKRRRNDKRRNALRTAVTACMMATGGGGAFAGMGLAMGHWQTVVVGSVVAAVFLLAGTWMEDALEERRGGHA